jgi:hypothetical protein
MIIAGAPQNGQANKSPEPTPRAGSCFSFDMLMLWISFGAAQLGRSAGRWNSPCAAATATRNPMKEANTDPYAARENL